MLTLRAANARSCDPFCYMSLVCCTQPQHLPPGHPPWYEHNVISNGIPLGIECCSCWRVELSLSIDSGRSGVVGVFHLNYACTDIRYIIANCFDFIRNFHNKGVQTPDYGLRTPWLLWMIAICNQCTTRLPPPHILPLLYFICCAFVFFSLSFSFGFLAFWPRAQSLQNHKQNRSLFGIFHLAKWAATLAAWKINANVAWK